MAQALNDAGISDEVGLWVAQERDIAVLKYNPDADSVLSRAKQVAKGGNGASDYETVPNT